MDELITKLQNEAKLWREIADEAYANVKTCTNPIVAESYKTQSQTLRVCATNLEALIARHKAGKQCP
jgi:hypothetical protein